MLLRPIKKGCRAGLKLLYSCLKNELINKYNFNGQPKSFCEELFLQMTSRGAARFEGNKDWCSLT